MWVKPTKNSKTGQNVQQCRQADALFVHVYIALIYAVPFGMNSHSCQSETKGVNMQSVGMDDVCQSVYTW